MKADLEKLDELYEKLGKLDAPYLANALRLAEVSGYFDDTPGGNTPTESSAWDISEVYNAHPALAAEIRELRKFAYTVTQKYIRTLNNEEFVDEIEYAIANIISFYGE